MCLLSDRVACDLNDLHVEHSVSKQDTKQMRICYALNLQCRELLLNTMTADTLVLNYTYLCQIKVIAWSAQMS